MKNLLSIGVLVGLSGALPVDDSSAQIIQLPTIRVFNVRTSVSVPDGGVISALGGVSRSARVQGSRGILGRATVPLRNRGVGFNSGLARAAVTANVIDLGELEAEVLEEASRRRLGSAENDPNGPAKVQMQADFITRNIGRKRNR